MKETIQLVKFILRRERIGLNIWTTCIAGLVIYMPFLYEGMYPTVADRYAAMSMMQNPAIVAIVGPSTGAYTLGALFTQEILLVTLVIIAIMNILLVNRHTRVDEELGRLELIRSFPVGSTSTLQAVFAIVILVNALIGGLIAIGLAMSGVESVTVHGSVLIGGIITMTGLLFATITAVCVQLFSTAKGASGYAFMVLLVMYLVRAVGDVSGNFLSYVSPLGLVLKARVYVDDIWWPIAAVLVQVVVLGGVAVYLISKRDLGMGLIPAKPGSRVAAKSLLSVDGLAWRLQRGSLIIWSISSFMIGVAYGAVIGEVEAYIGDNDIIQAILATMGDSDGSLIEQFIPFLILFLVIVLLIPVIGPILKLAGEEKRNLSEHLLTRVVSRTNLLKSYWLISMITSVILFIAGAFGFWLAGMIFLDEAVALSTLMSAVMVYLPAAWLIIGFAVILVGWLPKLMSLATIMIGFTFFIAFFSEILNLPQFLINLSPLAHVPSLPIDEFSAVTFLVMSIIAALLMIVGFIGYSRRDIQG